MKVLIGITTHNRAEILAKSIQSALDQDYGNKEVAVFDDSSTDDTPLLQAAFPQVLWYRAETNGGYLAARNKLMRETSAELYFSLDDDAWFLRGDEVSTGANLMAQRPEVAALAYDILTPDRPDPVKRTATFRTHTFIGCGHMLRLSAVREVGYYTPNPGFYGSEEKDLCVQLLDRDHEIMFLPGVHVWHAKSAQARDLEAQHRSGVCNDFVFALRRCPLPLALWLIPGKVISHLRFAVANDLLRPCLKGMAMFCASLPRVAPTRNPVSSSAFHEYLRRSRASA
jgi:GT2 family glycosyltransferase